MYHNVFLLTDGTYTSYVQIVNVQHNHLSEWARVGVYKTVHEAFRSAYLVNIGVNDTYQNHKDIKSKWVLDQVREFLLNHPYTLTDHRFSTWIIDWFETEGRKDMPKVAEFYVSRLNTLMKSIT